MNESRHSEDLSFINDSDHNLLAPIPTNQPSQKNPVFYQSKQQPNRAANRVINLLSTNRSTGKLESNDEFLDYLAQDEMNSNLNIVTFLGPKQVGKSFLVDFIISKEEKLTSRLLSKTPNPLVNIPTYQMRGKNGEKIIFFDTNENVSNDAFLWTYFLSSMMVLNLPQGDKYGQEQFLGKLNHLRISLQSQSDDLSLPQLIILRRDSNSKQFKDKEFVDKVASYGLFSSDIATLNMAYPGSPIVASKDIRDVSENMLSEGFVNDAQNLAWTIKSGRPKTIKGNYLGSKIAGLSLQPLTQSINKTGKVQTNKIWSDVIETLSVGYYNFYMKKYSEQLQAEFADEQPCDKYTLYKRLSKIRRNIDKKFQGFNMIAGDPTFEKYRGKIQQNVNKKEKIIKQINKRKSIERNDELCKKLFSQMNDSNCEALIQQYCDSKLDDNKSEVLLNNFETVIKRRLEELQKSKNPALKPSTQIQQLQKELKEIQDKIRAQKENKVEVVEYDFVKVKGNIELKQKQVRELQEQLERQKKISNEKKNSQNKDIIELQSKIQTLRTTTKEQQKQIERLKAAKEAQAKQVIEGLNKKLKEQEDRYQKLQQEVKKAQEVSSLGQKVAKQTTKQTCCMVM